MCNKQQGRLRGALQCHLDGSVSSRARDGGGMEEGMDSLGRQNWFVVPQVPTQSGVVNIKLQ
jgi:hypothetical protein